MRTRALLLLALPFAAGGGAALAGEPAGNDAERAIERAFGHLDANLFRIPDSQGTPRKPFTFAIAGLDYLMRHPRGASRTKRDPLGRITDTLAGYVEEVERKLEDPRLLPPRHGLASSQFLTQYTWPLAASAVYFAELEVRGLSRAQARKSMERIVAILAAAQQENGGWGHGRINPGNRDADPFPDMPGGYPDTLVSSSNVVAIAVGAMDTLKGLETAEMVKRARAYYRAARLSNGSFPYDPSQRSSGFAKINAGRTAGAIYAWHCLAMPRDRAFEGSVAYLQKNLEWVKEGHGSPCLNMMHGALAFHMLGKEAWKRFRAMYVPRIVAAQREDGALACICESKAFGVTCDSRDPFGGIGGGVFARGQAAYTTALHLFVLLLERNNLEILERRKPGGPVTRSGPSGK